MKKDFASSSQQMTYVNRFIHRNTDIAIKCQYCGKDGRIRYYRKDPTKIQIICQECANKRELSRKENWGKVLEDIPLIDIEEHITNKLALKRLMKLDEEKIKILENMLLSTKPKIQTYRETGITRTYLAKLIDEYTNTIDKDFKNKLNEHFREVRTDKIKRVKLNYMTKEDSHPLTKIRKERNISNEDLVRLTNNRITKSCLCAIQEGKNEPKLVTKIILAKALKVSVADIFPDDTEFNKVYCWNDYWFDIRNEVVKSLETYCKKEKEEGRTRALERLSEIVGIKVNRLYALRQGRITVTNDDIKKLKEHNIL